jgi:hypothetical protein
VFNAVQITYRSIRIEYFFMHIVWLELIWLILTSKFHATIFIIKLKFGTVCWDKLLDEYGLMWSNDWIGCYTDRLLEIFVFRTTDLLFEWIGIFYGRSCLVSDRGFMNQSLVWVWILCMCCCENNIPVITYNYNVSNLFLCFFSYVSFYLLWLILL